MKLLEENDVPVMPMHDLRSALEDPHLQATSFFSITDHPSEGRIRQMRMPMTWSDSQPGPERHAPRLGEHSVEVLQQVGFSDAEIEQLIEQGTVLVCGERSPAASSKETV